jgi:hypothetical protein
LREIAFDLESADIEAWTMNCLDRMRYHRLNYWVGAVAVSAGLAIFADNTFSSVVASSVGAVVGFGAGWVLARAAHRSYVRTIVRDHLGMDKGPSNQLGRHTLSIDESGVTEQGPAALHKHAWKAVLEVVQTADHIFVVVDGGAGYVVPKRAFPSSEATEAFLTALSSRVSQAP